MTKKPQFSTHIDGAQNSQKPNQDAEEESNNMALHATQTDLKCFNIFQGKECIISR